MSSNRKMILAVCGISAVCAGILLGCLFGMKREDKEFQAKASSVPSTSSWAASQSAGTASGTAVSTAEEAEKTLEEYPKTVKESSSEVVIDFTPSMPLEETDAGEESEPETEPDPRAEPEANQQDEPVQVETGGGGGGQETAGGGGNVINDPAFGEVYAGQAQQQEVDNDGDPDKQVGTM